MRRSGNYVSIDTTVDIDIDEYAEYISDDIIDREYVHRHKNDEIDCEYNKKNRSYEFNIELTDDTKYRTICNLLDLGYMQSKQDIHNALDELINKIL